MRKMFLMASLVLLSAGWAAAQNVSDPNPDFASRSAAYRATLEGCLDGAAGNYILTLPSGSIIHLAGKTEELTSHVGENVRVTGVVTPIVNVPGTNREATETEATLSVNSFLPTAGVCNIVNDIR